MHLYAVDRSVNRRDFLKTCLGLGAYALSLNAIPQKVLAQTKKKNLVMIYVPGGYDGMTFTPPYGDPLYYQYRPNIAIPESEVIKVSGSNVVGLNPHLAEFKDLYDAGSLGIFPAAQASLPSRSHFKEQDKMFSRLTTSNKNQGWLNQLLDEKSNLQQNRLVSYESNLEVILRGSFPVVNPGKISNLQQSVSEDLLNSVEDLSLRVQSLNLLDNLFGINTKSFFDLNRDLENIDLNNYSPDNGANYYNNGASRGFDVKLMQTANLIKQDLANVFYIPLPYGMDTHVNQINRFKTPLEVLSKNIKAFYDDLGDKMEDVAILVCTEFGRTVQENSNRGTDHGYASSWFLISKNLENSFVDPWPGLEDSSVGSSHRFVRGNVFFGDIYTEIIKEHLGFENTNNLFDNFTARPLGVFKQDV